MLSKYNFRKFGFCPRYYCDSFPLLPLGNISSSTRSFSSYRIHSLLGVSDFPGEFDVKHFCLKCNDVYEAYICMFDLCYSQFNLTCLAMDGAYIGTSLPQLLIQNYPDIIPDPGMSPLQYGNINMNSRIREIWTPNLWLQGTPLEHWGITLGSFYQFEDDWRVDSQKCSREITSFAPNPGEYHADWRSDEVIRIEDSFCMMHSSLSRPSIRQSLIDRRLSSFGQFDGLEFYSSLGQPFGWKCRSCVISISLCMVPHFIWRFETILHESSNLTNIVRLSINSFSNLRLVPCHALTTIN